MAWFWVELSIAQASCQPHNKEWVSFMYTYWWQVTYGLGLWSTIEFNLPSSGTCKCTQMHYLHMKTGLLKLMLERYEMWDYIFSGMDIYVAQTILLHKVGRSAELLQWFHSTWHAPATRICSDSECDLIDTHRLSLCLTSGSWWPEDATRREKDFAVSASICSSSADISARWTVTALWDQLREN